MWKRRPAGVRRNWVWFGIQVVLRIFFVLWLRYRAYGVGRVPRDGAALLVVNHQSFLDPLLVGLPLRRPVSYLARDNLFRVPVIGWILRNTYVMPIQREAAGSGPIRAAVERLGAGYLVGIFPEGTRTADGAVQPFRPGFLAIVKRAGVPIIPVGIAGAFEAYPRGAAFVRPRPVAVVFGEPIEISEAAFHDRDHVADLVQRVEQAVRECQQAARGKLGR